MPKLQGVRREDGEWRTRVAMARQYVENDVCGMHAMLQGFGASGLDRGQPVLENGGENLHL